MPVRVVEVLQVPGTARRPRGLVPWVTTGLAVVPLAGWLLVRELGNGELLERLRSGELSPGPDATS